MTPEISILSAIPNGQTISFAAFAKQVGPIANALAFTQPKQLSRQNSLVTITCAGPGKISSPQGSLEHQATVTADVAETGTNVTLNNINGVTAHNEQGQGGSVKKAVITPLPTGHFRIDATVDVLFFEITITRELDQNGQLV
jgi:hypothetical protein